MDVAGTGERVNPWWQSPQVSGVAGILFVGLSFLATAINLPLPRYDQDAAVVAAWFAENSARYSAGHFLAGIAFLVFYFVFFAGFCERLRSAEGTPAPWSRVTWAGAIVSPAVGTIAGAFVMGAALVGDRVSSEVALYAIAANFYAYVVSGAFGGVVMTASAVVIISTGVFPRWLGWTGAVIGVAAIASTATLVENDPQGLWATVNGLAWLAYFLWIALLSIVLLRVDRHQPAG